MINLKNVEPNLLKIDQKHYKGTNIYYIGYITIKKIYDYESIYFVNLLYMQVNHANGYIEEKDGINTWFLILHMNTKKYLKNADVWNRIKNKIKAINDIGENNYEKD